MILDFFYRLVRHPRRLDMRYLRLAITALGILFAPYGVCASGNPFVRGDHIAFFVTEFTGVETAQDKSYSMIRGVTITGRQFSVKAVWGQLKSCADFLERWKATRRSTEKPYYIAGFLTVESPMVVEVDSCVRDPENVDRSRKDIY